MEIYNIFKSFKTLISSYYFPLKLFIEERIIYSAEFYTNIDFTPFMPMSYKMCASLLYSFILDMT